MSRFTLPRDTFFGENTLEELKNLKGERAVIVIGGNAVKNNGALEKVENYLKDAGIISTLIEGVEADPSIETVQRGVDVMQSFQPDWIIGLGGGSPIDAAKAMWIFYEYPDFSFEQAAIPFNLPSLRKKARFVAVPTTSGTGTEVTCMSIITDNKTGIKYPIADFNITPDIAIVDTNLTKSMPKKLVAHTGMDALTHAFEGYVSTLTSDFTDALGLKAVEMIKENLVASFKGDAKANSNMHIAQCIAGATFSNAVLGNVHSLAHKTGHILNIPHGCANAIYLPYVIEFNKTVAGAKYADLAKKLFLEGDSEEELVCALVEMVKDLNVALDIPQTLQDYGIDEALFLSHVDEFAKTAVEDPCTSTNPRETSVEEMKQILLCAYYGKSVTF